MQETAFLERLVAETLYRGCMLQGCGLFAPLESCMIEPLRSDPLCIRCNAKMRFSCKEIEKPGFAHDVFECPKCRSTQSYVTLEPPPRSGENRHDVEDRRSGRDTRSEAEKQFVDERRSQIDRRSNLVRRA